MFNRFLSVFLLWGALLACQRDAPAPPSPSQQTTNHSDARQSVHLALGSPSNSTSNLDSLTNYLIERPQYVVSYNRELGRPNWVSWHLQKSDLGSSERKDDFRPDTELPRGWYQVKPTDYTSADGLDRGHLCPSADRTATQADNSATFLMTNILPQAPALNRGVWQELEAYCRELVEDGNELYIIAGGYGSGAIGSQGYKTSLTTGRVTAPAHCWKVIVVLPEGDNDLSRINASTPVIAVDMVNAQTVEAGWEDYITTVASIEKQTKQRLLENLSTELQTTLKAKIYSLQSTTTQPGSPTVTPPATSTVTPPTSSTITPPATSTVTAPISTTTTSPTTSTVTPPTTATVTPPTTATITPPTITPPTTTTTTPPSTGTVTQPSTGTPSTGTGTGDIQCGFYNGKQLYKGPKGGCYYINSKGNKTYVDRSYCNC